jgi:osmotically inducible protein OsmC
MKRKASALWQGDLKTGKGHISTESGVLKETQYSFGTRFENGVGTNPEELIAAAHSGCFAMAFSSELGKVGLKAESIHVTATVTLEMLPTGPTVTESHLEVTVKVPGADHDKVLAVANTAKAGCPISRLLTAKVTMDAKVEV